MYALAVSGKLCASAYTVGAFIRIGRFCSHDFHTSYNSNSPNLVTTASGPSTGPDNLIDLEFADQVYRPLTRSTLQHLTATKGKFIFTAPFSRHLSVDNGIKSWYLSGQLLHVQDCEEL